MPEIRQRPCSGAPVGELVFSLPGNGEVRSVEAPDLQTWWLEGTGEDRAAKRADRGYGRELFGWMRQAVGPADAGACALFEAG